MSKVDKIRSIIAEFANSHKHFSKNDLLKKFPGQGPLVAYALNGALKQGILIKRGTTRGVTYESPKPIIEGDSLFKTYRRGKQSEDDIFIEIQDAFLSKYKINENIIDIITYGFTEMVNNAIDHSDTDVIDITIMIRTESLSFTIRDYGIGIFKNIKEQKHLPDERLALAELTKGKMTTAPKWHSGEGIFFTSRAGDLFQLTSGKLTLRRDSIRDDVTVIEHGEWQKGTSVEFTISLTSDRHLARDVFQQFTSNEEEPDFGKTEIAVKLFKRGNVHVSRSQAKRLMFGLEKFKIVLLDFDGVPLIGQGFADQIFRVFSREHPETKIITENTNDAVRFMIDRVKNNER